MSYLAQRGPDCAAAAPPHRFNSPGGPCDHESLIALTASRGATVRGEPALGNGRSIARNETRDVVVD